MMLHAFRASCASCGASYILPPWGLLQPGLGPLYYLTPKHHALTHIAYDNCGVNPWTASCYGDEDMVGRMKRIYARGHGRAASRRWLLG